MSDEGKFLVSCVERYRSAKGLSGREVSELFTRCGVWDYVYSCYGALHTTGENYVIEDIDGFIRDNS